MEEQVKKIQQAMNDYLVDSHAEERAIYHNLELFYNLSRHLENGLSEHFENQNEDVDYSKISKVPLFNRIELIQGFYKEIDIEFDFDKYMSDGTIDFVYYDYFNNNEDIESIKLSHFGRGNSTIYGTKKIINTCNNELITDVLVTVHELSHFRNQPDDGRNQTSDLLTESLAYAEELICTDYLTNLGYKDDMALWKKFLFSTFYYLAKEIRPVYKMFLLYKELGDISESSYEYYYKTKDEYEKLIEYMSRFEKNKTDFQLYYETRYVMGAILGTYMFSQYRKDKNFSKNISDLHNDINNLNTLACFKIIGLEDLGDQDKEKFGIALEEIKSELNEMGCKKSK